MITRFDKSVVIWLASTAGVAFLRPWDEALDVPLNLGWGILIPYFIIIGWCFWYGNKKED